MQTSLKAIPNVHLAVHGGTGIPKSQMTPERDHAVRAGLDAALRAGHEKLMAGGSSLDAVEAAVRSLEDCPQFNAGKGSVFTANGTQELDAAIMDGKNLKAGSIAGVTTVKNPISLARIVMEKTEHVMLISAGAEEFAREAGVTLVEPSYFYTQEQWDALQRTLKAKPLDSKQKRSLEGHSFGTVGAVALDSKGNLASATSTGGMTGKRPGRVGDSPIIGGGTYADNETAAISATGWGEFFIRYTVAHDVAALMRYKQLSILDAVNEVIHRKIAPAGGDGAVISIDRNGCCAFAYASDALYRGCVTRDGIFQTALYES